MSSSQRAGCITPPFCLDPTNLEGMERALRTPQWVSSDQVRALAFAIAVGGVTLVLLVLLPRQGTIIGSQQRTTTVLPRLGIEFEYPSNWHIQSFGDTVGHAEFRGTVVSNVEHNFVHPDLGPKEATSAWDMRGLPEDLIVVSFQQLDHLNFEAKRTHGFPLALENADVSNDAEEGIDTYGAPQPRYFIPFEVEGHLSSGVQVYIGDVNADERAIVDEILASVRPLSSG